MIRITRTKRCGVEIHRAVICVAGHVYRESVHMSEQGARSWVARQLNEVSRAQA